MIRLHAHPPPPPFPLLFCPQLFSLSQSSCVSLVELTEGKDLGGGRGAVRKALSEFIAISLGKNLSF
jgi:hypothetical protein